LIVSWFGAASARAAVPPVPESLLTEATLPAIKATQKRKKARSAIPLEMNPHIQYWVNQFTGPLRDRFGQFLERGAYYQTRIQEILAQNHMPPELFYLAMIESGFVTDITSRVGAAGTWQFMGPTARLYGLKTELWVDERLDFIRATDAACKYLGELHREFGSWYLAMAAYNSGEGRVHRAIRRGRSRSYWKLVRRGALPRETSQYVPQFQAAMRIAKNPEAYGFPPLKLYNYPKLKKYRVEGATPLVAVAEKLAIPYETLRALNRHVIVDSIPAHQDGYELWVPISQSKPEIKEAAVGVPQPSPVRALPRRTLAEIDARGPAI
jgi:membrane-bound lytic murein transglycosylase D